MAANDEDDAIRARVQIVNDKGLHARASAKLAALAVTFAAQIILSRDGLSVNAASIMGLLMLVASKGSSVDIEARGVEAADAVRSITSLIADGFGEAH